MRRLLPWLIWILSLLVLAGCVARTGRSALPAPDPSAPAQPIRTPSPQVPASPTLTEPASSPSTPVPTGAAVHLAGRWIEVDLTKHVVHLHDGETVLASHPAATGEGSRPEYTTWTGLFQVQQKYKGPEETVPGVFVSDILVFDLAHGNGFHSFPKDRDGKVLDARVGMAITAGCIRTAESAAIYDFAELGTRVWVH
jgi:lipoprotein-anchoring transpeptidase ErfK/SrfK